MAPIGQSDVLPLPPVEKPRQQRDNIVVPMPLVDSYESFNNTDLQYLCARKDIELSERQDEANALVASRNYYGHKCDELKQTIVALKEELRMKEKQVLWRPNRNVSTYGGYSLAIRRNNAHAGAAASG